MRIAVIGGGISGLAAAHRITELLPTAGLILCEASSRLGGVLETVRRDDYLLERSADSFITRFPWGVQLCERLGIADELVPTDEKRRRALVVRDGELLRVPDGFVLMTPGRVWPIVTSRVLSWRGKLRLLAEPLMPRRRVGSTWPLENRESDDESVASFATRRLGREVLERLVQPLMAGIYTADADQLSMAATLPEFMAQEAEHGRLTRGQSRPSESGARYGLFVAPKNGIGSIVQAIAARLPPTAVRLNTRVAELERSNNHGWRLMFGNGDAESFDAVVLALPAPAAANLVAACDPELASELAAIQYAGCAVVSMAYRCDQLGRPLDAFGFVVPRIERRPIIAASFASQKFPGRAPDGQSLIRVFIGGALDPAGVDLPADTLQRIAHRELSVLLHITGEPLWTDVARWPQSMPQYHVGHLARIARIEARAAKLPRLALAGNAYRGVGIPQCIHSGEAAAERVVALLA